MSHEIQNGTPEQNETKPHSWIEHNPNQPCTDAVRTTSKPAYSTQLMKRRKKKPRAHDDNDMPCTLCSQPLYEKGPLHVACSKPKVQVTYADEIVDHAKQCVYEDVIAGPSSDRAVASTRTTPAPPNLPPPATPSDPLTTTPATTRQAPIPIGIPRTPPLRTPMGPPRTPPPQTPAESPPRPSSVAETIDLPFFEEEEIDEGADTLQTPLLEAYGLVVKTRHKVLICIECKSVIDPADIRQHFFNQHPLFRTPRDLQTTFNAEANERFPNLYSQPPFPQETLDIIPELGEPVENYHKCQTCHHCYKNTRNFNKHPCEAENPSYTLCLAQRWIQNNNSPWFSVQHPSERPRSPTTSTPWTLYEQQQRESDSKQSSSAAQTDDFRILHQFLRKERWTQLTEGYTHEQLMPLVEYSTLDETYGTLARHIHSFFHASQTMLDTYYLRRIISTRPAEEHDALRVRHHGDVGYDTHANYARILASLITFIDRISNKELSGYSLEIPPDISRATRDLIQHLGLTQAQQAENYEEEQAGESEEELEGYDSDNSEISPNTPANDAELPGHRHPPTSHPTTQRKLLHLLYLIFSQTPTAENRGAFFSPVIHHIVLTSLRKKEAWAAGNTITHNIAAIAFAGRLTFAREILRLSSKHSITYSAAFARISSHFEEQNHAILPHLYLLKRGLGGINSAEESALLFNAPDLSGTGAIIGDKTLRLSQIGDLHCRAVEELKAEIDELTFHHPDFQLDPEIPIHDEPRERTPGYSFLEDKRNPWIGKKSLTQYILETPHLFSQFAYINSKGKVCWKPSFVDTWRNRIHRLWLKFLCLIILSYGEPARGTELASHLLANVGGGSIRNFFILFGLPILRASWNKTSGKSESDKPICRIPHLPIGMLFVRFLVFLRPLFIQFQRYLRPSLSFNARHYLFPGLNHPLTSMDISNALLKYTETNLKIPLRIRIFRQFMAFITECNKDTFDVVQASSTAMYEQLGHTAEINARHYGHDSRVPDGMNFGKFMTNARVSGVFHMLYGHSTELLERLESGRTTINNSINTILQIRHRPPPSLPSPSNISPQLTIEDIANTLKPLILPDIIDVLRKTLAESTASLVDHINTKPISSTPLAPASNHTVHPHPHLYALIRQLYPPLSQGLGGFSNKEQAIATQVMLERKKHVIYIAPTGSGKSTPAILCAKYLEQNRSTIWLLPLVSLHNQVHYNSQRFGLACESWTYSMSSNHPPTFIPATIDVATYDSFQKFVDRLISKDLLARVIIDECHLVLTHANFRSVMRFLQWLGSKAIPIVLITATLPPSLETPLLNALGITSAVTIRAPTPRPNISFRVVRAKDRIQSQVITEFKNALLYSSTNKVLLFCETRSQTEYYAHQLKVDYCHSGVGKEKLTAILNKFRHSARGLVSTSILGVGLDVPDVTHVLHAGCPRDVVAFIQEAGRAGRKNSESPAWSIVIIPENPSYRRSSETDLFGEKIVAQTIYEDSECRRVPLQTFLDGTADSCTMLGPTARLCDVCETKSQSTIALQETNPSAHLLLAAAHSRKMFSKKDIIPDELAIRLQQVDEILNHFYVTCIACALIPPESRQDHLFRECTHHPSPFTQSDQWTLFKNDIKYPQGTCYQCGIPQNIHYINQYGEKCYLHEFQDDPSVECKHAGIIPALMFTISNNDTLLSIVHKSRLMLSTQIQPLQMWISTPSEYLPYPKPVALIDLFANTLVNAIRRD
ncbi:hypothetical protein NP233_g12145 [Leucocoprinus birnbaumii]|uniref:DNA 3'-5' helicase n=1 Tax=Leucocoprinus birnbaumii TaxID=56174 RepID=A0AAD5YKP6_9AGAR|nr:hypothetical protein NP233_g12145 [Leucocoprinus birnbaumii]